jgi:tetratricopeptide (TPR) repeat protein
MKKSGKLLLVFLIAAFSSLQTFGQTGVEEGSRFGSGQDSIRCLKNLSLYVEFYRQNNYEDAASPWSTVYNECPRATKNIYLHGEKMLTDAIEDADDQAKKAQLVDSLMRLYDKRIKYFDQKGYVLGKKGLDYIEYSEKTIENLKKGYEWLAESIELRGNKSSLSVLVFYLNTSSTLFNNDELSGEAMLDNYATTLEITEKQLAQSSNDSRIEKARETLDKIFDASGAATCENLVALYQPRFEKNKDDKELINKIITMLEDSKCLESDFYMQVNIRLNEIDPTAEHAHHLAQLYYEDQKIDKAIQYFKQAIELQDDKEEKAGYYMQLASLAYEDLDDMPTSRSYALKAAELDPDNGRPYILIGRMYTESVDQCGTNDFEKKAVLWAAVDKFIKAKQVDPDMAEEANGYINSYQPRFPDKKTIFFQNYEIGDTYNVGCWINETTRVRTSE